MDRSSESEFRTALASASACATSATCRQSAEYFSAPSESTSRGMGESGGSLGSIQEQIERSKSHWSELADSGSTDDDGVAADNLAVFEELQRHPSWGYFFKTFGHDTQVRYSSGTMEVGEKFAEGGQAELFHAKITWKSAKQNEKDAIRGIEWVVKVFKRGTLLRDLQKQWPQGYLHWRAQYRERSKFIWRAQYRERSKFIKPSERRHFCDVCYGILLSDGRFAFVMRKEHMDLRSLIDLCKLGCGYDHGPFQEEDADWYMYHIALGMDWLHKHKVVHRDLKASNVLVSNYKVTKYSCFVADFECSVGVVGTGFWRAPEILQALKDKTVNQKPELFSEQADAYSYAMTCYEVLTGKIPFEDDPLQKSVALLTNSIIKYDVRPEVPDYVNVWTRDLLQKCWESSSSIRPSFEDILEIFEANSKSERINHWATMRDKSRSVVRLNL